MSDNDKDKLPGSYRYLSGSAKRKKKITETQQNAQLARQSQPFFAAFKQQLQTPSTSTGSTQNLGRVADAEQEHDSQDDSAITHVGTDEGNLTTADLENPESSSCDETSGIDLSGPSFTWLGVKLDDPVTWPLPISAAFRRLLVTTGPVCKTRESYPQRLGYSFHSSYFQFNQKGVVYQRQWLLYSDTENSLFCFPCSFFGSHTTAQLSPFQLSDSNKDGFNDFNHKGRAIQNHEASQTHFSNTTSWKLLQKQLSSSHLLDNVSEREIQIEIGFWKKVLNAVLDAILFLAKNNLAFRGQSSNILDVNCGNFLSLIKLLANYYPPLATHLERVKKHQVSYLSSNIQNEFIVLCGNRVRHAIIEEIRQAKYFTILIDATPDSSRQEQISEVIRIVDCCKDGCSVKEYFVDFVATEEKTGEGLSQVIIEKLLKDGLDIADCRGQGYDNGANMSGAYKGVQRWILNVSPKAQFIPCAAHSLNLVGVNAAEHVAQAKMSLGQIQNLFQYFHASTSRWQFLNSKLKTTLKGQSTTRWSSRADSVEALALQYWNVVETLIDIANSSTFNAETVAGAESHLTLLLTFKFLLSVKNWNKILQQINLCNLTLQKETGSLEMASKKLQALLGWLNDFRKTGFNKCLSEALAQAQEFGIDSGSGFEDKRSTRGVRRKRLGERSDDAGKSLTNLQKFEYSFFNELLDNLVVELGSRFEQIKFCNDDFKFLWGTELETTTTEKLIKSVQDLC